MAENGRGIRPPKYGNHYSRRKVDEVIALIVLVNPPIDQISKKTGVSERQLYRWYKDDEFIERLNTARHNVYEPGNMVLRQEYKNTVLALVAMRDDKNVSDAVRLGAMRTLLEYGRMVDVNDYYAAKLAKLESKTIDATAQAIPVSDNAGPEWASNTPDWKDQPQDWQQ
jgi:hypothetical protein